MLGTNLGAPLYSVRKSKKKKKKKKGEGSILLPIRKWFIAKEPIPLPVSSVVHGWVREERA